MFAQHLQNAIAQQTERQRQAAEEPATLEAAERAAEFPFRTLPDDEIEQLAGVARAEAEKLTTEANKREGEARKAQSDFQVNPDQKTHAAHAIADRVWQNAAQAVAKHAEDTRPLLDEAKRRTNLLRLTELRTATDVSDEIGAAAARVVTLFEQFQASISEELQRLGATLAARDELLEELNNLARKCGTGGPEVHRPIPFDRAVATLGDAVAARFGRAQDGGNFGRLSWWVPGGRADLAVADAALRIPCPTVSGG